ncbi:MAG: hypothetical protein E4H23_02100 [Chrysiogenales bacterium]|nr:MAG: hypothetical protein E4H23_02100 [Chrysiogenales bacterium]
MKKKLIISFLFITACVMFLAAATNNQKALELIKKGNESYRVHKNPSQAFLYFKQAVDLASGRIKVDALLKTAYMSHWQGNKIPIYQNFIKEALKIDPEKKIEPTEYRSSFRQIFNDIKNRENIIKKPAAPKAILAPPRLSIKKAAEKNTKKQIPQKAITAKQSKYFMKISYAMGMAGSDQNQSWSEALYGENSDYSITSKMGNSQNFNLGCGYNISRAIGIGLGAIIQSNDLDATVNASVPSPWVFDSPRSASTTYATTLKSNIFYLDFIYKLIFSKLNLNFFAGPAYFNSSTEVINAIEIQDVFPNDTVTISLATEKVKKNSLGFSGGLALNFFFSSHLGVFVEGRYLSGSGTFTPTTQTVPGIKLTLGGMNVGAGLIFQF